MDLIGLFKVTRHFSKQLVGADPYVHGKTECVANFIFYGFGDFYRIGIQSGCAAHIEKTLVDRVDLYHRSIFAANIHKSTRTLLIECKIGFCNIEVRAFSQSHCNRLARFNAVLFGGNGLCQNDTATAFSVSTNGGGNETNVAFPILNAPCGFPGKKGAINVDVKNQTCHSASLKNYFGSRIGSSFKVSRIISLSEKGIFSRPMS